MYLWITCQRARPLSCGQPSQIPPTTIEHAMFRFCSAAVRLRNHVAVADRYTSRSPQGIGQL
ncbi:MULTISPECIES: hypothetical protein [Cutibacterium]|uniref:Uncharacterized protein n=1 Tax=Cutibacterium acnes TaxID=1747 RepID=A0AA44U4F7_CUTAC|nr:MULTISPECIES: hypothetical protein [Cutibacterium]MBX7475282.1 hypothetical protein [Streptomyces sp. MAG02]NKN51726.1 hypothetical protein [Clostridioides difficile]EFT65275.1 hypothetical protein HMPREF9582_01114 [Cutibacterium acnes HL060PA1]MBU5171181.1 hypothetical protein [Cutibacterium acnes]MBU5175733.1 hypothetical protein [Cutibacterium acnes]